MCTKNKGLTFNFWTLLTCTQNRSRYLISLVRKSFSNYGNTVSYVHILLKPFNHVHTDIGLWGQ